MKKTWVGEKGKVWEKSKVLLWDTVVSLQIV